MNLSLVIACKNTSPSIRKALQCALDQTGPDDEILVLDASTDDTPHIVRTEFPQVPLLRLPPATLIPRLWTEGIREAKKDLVALTIGNCVPQPSWRRAVDDSIAGCAGLGGAIETSPSASVLATAVYLCRYWRYSLPFQLHETADLPGDNAVYKRRELLAYEPLFEKGFVEPFINARMVQDGHRLLMSPDMVVVHEHPFAPGPFLKNRVLHGISFAMERSRKSSRAAAAMRLLLSPGIPLILMSRILPRAFRARGSRIKVLLSLPFLFLFLTAWACGEGAGYVKSILRSRT